MHKTIAASLLRVTLVVTVAALPQAAAAATSAEEAAADAQFQQAISLMDASRYAEACPHLERAQALDPGMATQFRLAECYEAVGKLASAWRNYTDVSRAARAAGMADRERTAHEKLGSLKPRLVMVRVSVGAAARAMDGLKVLVNGDEVLAASWDGEVAADAGALQVEAKALGRKPWTRPPQTVAAGEAIAVEVPVLDPEPASSGADEGLSTQSAVGIALGVTGFVTAAVGVALGLVARANWQDSADECQGDLCTEAGLTIRSDARGLGNAGTALFVVGGALAATGIVVGITGAVGGARAMRQRARRV